MADINAIASQFTKFYYSTFDSDRSNLGSLYVSSLITQFTCPHGLLTILQKDVSMLTFEGTAIQGSTAIIEKLTVRNPHSPLIFLAHTRVYPSRYPSDESYTKYRR
jgi:hypothetical protein